MKEKKRNKMKSLPLLWCDRRGRLYRLSSGPGALDTTGQDGRGQVPRLPQGVPFSNPVVLILPNATTL